MESNIACFPPLPPPFIPILINFSPRRHHPVDLFPPAKLKTGTWIKEHLVKKTHKYGPPDPAILSAEVFGVDVLAGPAKELLWGKHRRGESCFLGRGEEY